MSYLPGSVLFSQAAASQVWAVFSWPSAPLPSCPDLLGNLHGRCCRDLAPPDPIDNLVTLVIYQCHFVRFNKMVCYGEVLQAIVKQGDSPCLT